MSTPERCLAQAEEAERMAALVSYERDRERLLRQAVEWRARAEALEKAADDGVPPSGSDPAGPGWRRLLPGLSRRRARDG